MLIIDSTAMIIDKMEMITIYTHSKTKVYRAIKMHLLCRDE